MCRVIYTASYHCWCTSLLCASHAAFRYLICILMCRPLDTDCLQVSLSRNDFNHSYISRASLISSGDSTGFRQGLPFFSRRACLRRLLSCLLISRHFWQYVWAYHSGSCVPHLPHLCSCLYLRYVGVRFACLEV